FETAPDSPDCVATFSDYQTSPDGLHALLYKNCTVRDPRDLNLKTGELTSIESAGLFSPDGNWFAGENGVFTPDGTRVATLPTASVVGWNWSPDSQRLAHGNGLVRRDGTDLKYIPLPGVPVQPDGTLSLEDTFPRLTVWTSNSTVFTVIALCRYDVRLCP